MPKRKKPSDQIKDEPGAADRFKRILGRALNTPPPRKQADAHKRPAVARKK